MVRQCAWCLRIIDNHGERMTAVPQPKLYEATHGICYVCGMQWLEKVEQGQNQSIPMTRDTDDRSSLSRQTHTLEISGVGMGCRASRRFE